MKRLLIILLLFVVHPLVGQGIYKADGVAVGFFSSAPIEDIEAHTNGGLSLWNTRNGEISFRIAIRGFQFEKAKMQEHFNEDFMESHTYPFASFKGELVEEIDPAVNANYETAVKGELEIHGVVQTREIPVAIEVKDGRLVLRAQFEVAVAEHDIKIPKILWNNIAEVVRVKVTAEYSKMEQ